MLNERANGVLMHISSLPGTTGIGTLGKSAYRFVDFLKSAGQRYWQVLPVGPTSYGDSPYQSFSTFAGNPYFIDFDTLRGEGYLDGSDYEGVDWGGSEHYVDYGTLYTARHKVFAALQARFEKRPPADFADFCRENSAWLDDYALFMAVKDAHGGAAFGEWEDDIRLRRPDAVAAWRVRAKERIQYYEMLQYFFFKQWRALKSYANGAGIEIIGDIPIYVAADSADVWAAPGEFALDEDLRPVVVAGVPPDYFAADGQLWGNPVYNWERMKETGYAWWRRRLEKCLSIYDVIRIDHFRGFDEYYCVPFGAKTAKGGEWRPGPGMDLFRALEKDLPRMKVAVIAEDLGLLTDSVRKLLNDSGFPGMKVLQFAFDNPEGNEYIPYRYDKNCVVYTGTHDNDTILGWARTADKNAVANAKAFLRVKTNKALVREMMIAAMSSVANTCILTMQDLSALGREARMNIPSTVGNNWKWRATKDQFSDEVRNFLTRYTRLYGRAAK